MDKDDHIPFVPNWLLNAIALVFVAGIVVREFALMALER